MASADITEAEVQAATDVVRTPIPFSMPVTVATIEEVADKTPTPVKLEVGVAVIEQAPVIGVGPPPAAGIA